MDYKKATEIGIEDQGLFHLLLEVEVVWRVVARDKDRDVSGLDLLPTFDSDAERIALAPAIHLLET